MIPELRRIVPPDRADGLVTVVRADEAERRAVAKRLGLVALAELTCRFALRRLGGSVEAEGVLRVRAVRTCVVTLEEFDAELDERFSVRFVPEGTESDDPDPDSIDEIPYGAAGIDLGEAAVEQLALLLDPYPRRPGAELPDAAAEGDANPFAALARLRPPH